MDNYLELQIGDATQEIIELANEMPGLLSDEMKAWSVKLDDTIEKLRDLVERRTKYVTVRWMIDQTCHRCKAGEERNAKGQHAIFEKSVARCRASGLWDELAKIEKENADVE